MKLEDLKIIITGAGGGMGAYFAKQIALAGGQVAAGDVNEEGLAALAAETADAPGTVHTRRLDVVSEADTEAFTDWAADKMGGLNGVISNAGILRDGLLVKKDRKTGEIIKMSRDNWQAVIDVNLTGATWIVRDAVAKMVALGNGGVVINMSSLARHGNRGQSNYVAAKAALAANTVTWAREFAPFGIRVGAIAPGMVETPMTRGMNQKARDALVAAIPVGRIGVPHDIWLGVKFIVECDYFNGRVVDIDGGLHM
ncbi:MAG: SDR family oxidoreductase [Deltaproteobacteria bacterium]|nr:MAG: SDR family oxidoreductase [Deltaproteobacteria bacterium]